MLLGPNCLGVQSRPGKLRHVLHPRCQARQAPRPPGRGVAFISQSGAFIITRLSNLETLDPLLTISIGNQAT
jgi:acyl-CoA synthetase (NDP forming)